jgi:hypothetical protein
MQTRWLWLGPTLVALWMLLAAIMHYASLVQSVSR